MSKIEDVANLCGCSLSTVSRVINDSGPVSEETRKKVMEAVQKLNYRPNKNARKLVKKSDSGRLIGVYLPTMENQFFFEMLKKIRNVSNSLYYDMIIFHPKDRNDTIFSRIIDEDLSLLIVIATCMKEKDKINLHKNNIPILVIDAYEKECHNILFDNIYGGKVAANYLLMKGVTRVGYIGGNSDSLQQKERFKGFEEEIQKNGMELSFYRKTPLSISMSEKAGYVLTKQIIENQLADGIFFFCDELAFGGVQAKREMDSQISMIGYDNLVTSKIIQLSSIDQSYEEIEHYIRETLQIRTNYQNRICAKIKPKLVLRD